MIIKINRNGNYQTYEINNIEDRITILEVLEQIKNYQDQSLSYRAQCRASVCGTCGLKVNNQTVLACKTKVKDLAVNDEIVIEPLSNMPVIKDLVVDYDEFSNKFKKAKAWLIPKEPFERVYPEDLATYDRETDCILCGICYSVCPAFANDKDFGGPINFVKIFRFWKDKNDALNDGRIQIAAEIYTSCIHCKYCTFSCPNKFQ